MVTWLLGVVGDVTVILVGAGAGVLLEMLDGIEGLVLSGKKNKIREYVNNFHKIYHKASWGSVCGGHCIKQLPASFSDSESSSSSSSLEQLDSSFFPSPSSSSTFSGSRVSILGAVFSGSSRTVSLLKHR